MIKVISLIIALTVTGSVSASLAESTDPPAQDVAAVTGMWAVRDSSARFRIFLSGGRITIEGWDSKDGEKFIINDVSWDGKRLRGTFIMPSTGHTTFSELTLVDDHTLRGTYRGDTAEGDEVWDKIDGNDGSGGI